MSVKTILLDFAKSMYEETLCVPTVVDVPFAVFDRLAIECRFPIANSADIRIETGYGEMQIVCSAVPIATGRGGLCEECQDLEMARSSDCYAKYKAASVAGQPFECECDPVPCDCGPPPHVLGKVSK